MNEIKNLKSKLIIPIPPRHIIEKYTWAVFEVSNQQLFTLAICAIVSMILLGVSSMFAFPLNMLGYITVIVSAYLYRKYAWTHEMLIESKTMFWFWYYKRQGLMNISYTDVYAKIKTLFPYEIKNINNGIINFGNGMFGMIISLTPRKMSPEEFVEFTPVIERLIDSLPPELIFKCRAKTKITGGNILEKMVLEQLQTVKTKEEKALLFSLYDKSKEHDTDQKWEHTLFIGIQSTEEEVETYTQTVLPGIINMLKSSRVICTHVIDPIKILNHYSSDFTIHEQNDENQAPMMVSKISKLTNPLSQMIHGGARFEQEHISFDGEYYASLIVVGLPENLIGGWPDDLNSQVLPRLYTLSDSKEQIIEINVTLKPIETGESMDEIKAVLATIEVNKAGNKTTSNLRVLSHSEHKYGAILEMLQDGRIRLNEVSYIITVRAKNADKLAAGVSKVRAVLRAYSIKTQKAKGNVKDVFKATRLFPIYYPDLSTCMPTTAIAKVMPLANGSENISSNFPGKYSIYFGDDIKTHHEYIFNLGEMGANHAVIVGATRSGKTTGLAILGMRAILAGFRIIYITVKPDETTNYLNVAKHFGTKGEIIYLGRGRKNINPMEVLFDPSMIFDAKQTFFQHVTILKQFINQLCASKNQGDALNSLQLAYVERSLLRVYAKFGISPTDPQTWKQEKQPTLIDLFNIWNSDKELDTKESVQAAVLESRTTSLTHNWDFLSEKTSISLDKDYIVIDLSALPGDLIPAMNYFMTAIIGLRFRADVKRKNIVMIDEGRAFMKTGLGEDIIKIATQGGSQGVAIWFASQQPKDMASISSELLNNAFIRIVFANNTEVPEVAAALRLPQSDQDFLATCTKPGQMLVQMKSPFNQTYHCELNLSGLEKEILFGNKQLTEPVYTCLSPELEAFAKEQGVISNDWMRGDTKALRETMAYEQIQRSIGKGKVWMYSNPELMKDGKIKNQTPDHYFTVAQIAGDLIMNGLKVQVNHYEDCDIVVDLPDGKLAIEYQTSIEDGNRPERIMKKWETGINRYERLIFVGDTQSTKELKQIIKTEGVVLSRGTELEKFLKENVYEKTKQNEQN